MVVLLEDDAGNPPNTDYCQSYADKYGLPQDKLIVAIDPLKKSQIFYESPVVSLSVITDRKGVIVYKDDINAPLAFKWQIDYELKKMCEELQAEDNEDEYDQGTIDMCAGYDFVLP